MKRAEIFSLVAGFIGLVADLIALSHFVEARQQAPASVDSSGPNLWFALLLVYGWFLVCWFLFQYARSREKEYGILSDQEENHLLAKAVGATGILLLPVAMIILYPIVWNFDAASGALARTLGLFLGSLVAMGLAGGCIFVAVRGLTSVIVGY